MKLLVGLGNPGLKYAKTRHNIGFMTLNDIAKELGIKLKKNTNFHGEYSEIIVNGERIMLLKPLTYMNRSGDSVQSMVSYFKIAPSQIMVIYDDLDLPVGTAKFRKTGGHGGHNGIRSLIQHLGTKEFNRARIGIGRPPEGKSVTSHVLNRFSKGEKAEVDNARLHVTKACTAWMETSFDQVMNHYN
ncbi:PTH1 family peptidyl-tRNA hydrolase [Geomicrobium halophilum]|uniref:Peptidyl-tRNA hydrolase n=1 Tax=Geomicrobium halophilum TaxID=549000 RepID=A0A841PRV5_9BACL|nr:aminoacyl-tRNA hydrolase [Geomicrobium halophilum]MBB6451530.1 PTH1 family peptidyl-tRNA hydrolase [Geomicrobium halophilum]